MQKVLKILDDNNLLDDFNFRFVVSKQDGIVSVLTQPVLKKGREPDKKELPIFVAAATIDEIEETLHEKILEALNTSQTSLYKISEFAKQMETAAKDKEKELKKQPETSKSKTKTDDAKKSPDRKDGLFSKSDLEKKPDPKEEKEKTESDKSAKEKTAKEILAEKRKTKNQPVTESETINAEPTAEEKAKGTLGPDPARPAEETEPITTDADQPVKETKGTPPEGKEEYGSEW